jgi:hypothetical protein
MAAEFRVDLVLTNVFAYSLALFLGFKFLLQISKCLNNLRQFMPQMR